MNTKFTLKLLIGLFLLTTTIHAQFQWAFTLSGGNGIYNKGKRIVTDATGNAYTAGEFGGTMNFDPGPGTYTLNGSTTSCFVQKVDASANFVWAVRYGGNTVDGISKDASGNLLLCGFFYGTADFDPGPGTYTLASISGSLPNTYALKLDPNGNFLWAVRFGDSNTTAKDISNDAAGNVFITGMFSGVQDFDPGAGTFNMGTATVAGGYILKLDANGNFVFAKEMKSISTGAGTTGTSIELDGLGNIITTGYFGGTVDFDPSAATYTLGASGSANDIFIEKLDASGNFIWAHAIGTPTASDLAYAVTIDASNNIYSSGNFANTVDFDPGAGVTTLTATGTSDAYIWKLDVNGNFVWAKNMGTNANALCHDAVGDIYSIGTGSTGDDIDPGAGTYTVNGSYIQKLDASGNFVWGRDYGVFPMFNDISVNGSDIYFTGRYLGTVDFDPDAPVYNLAGSFAGYNLFVSKLTSFAVSVNEYSITDANLKAFPNPSNGNINLLFEKPYTGSLQVFDVSGKQIHSQTLTKETELKLDLTKYNSGIYFVKTEDTSFKIVIR